MEAMGQGRALASARYERVECFGEPTSNRPAMPSMPSRRWGVSLAARLVDPAEPIGDCRRRTRSRSVRGRRRTRSRSRSAPRRRRTQTPTAPWTQSRSTLRRCRGRSHLEIPPLADFAPRRLGSQGSPAGRLLQSCVGLLTQKCFWGCELASGLVFRGVAR